MIRKEKKILHRVEETLKKYHEDSSIYYEELKKSYNEYIHLLNVDKTTKELYLTHMETLCTFILEKMHLKLILGLMLSFFVFMLFLTCYSTIRYFDLAKNIKENKIKTSMNTSLLVSYTDLENFNALSISNEDEYYDLKPLKIKLTSTNETEKKKKIQYEIYLVEQNEQIEINELIPRTAFLYHVKSKGKETGIKYLKNSKLENNKILLYNGVMQADAEENIEIRMWLDAYTKEDIMHKKYRFKLYVKGYEIEE